MRLEQPDSRGRQLKRQREAVEPHADFRHNRGVAGRQVEAGAD